MTAPQTEQLELKAGRELDALVAEKVMSFPVERWPEDDYTLMKVPGTNWAAGETRDGKFRPTEFLPQFSTDIAAAWEVVERMHSRGFTVAVMRDAGDEEPSCEIAKPEWTGSEVWSGKTAPLAICLCALKAVQS